MAKATDHIREYKMIYSAAAVIVVLLGGSVGITLPVDGRVDELETQYAQNWQQQQMWHQQQDIIHKNNKIRDIQGRMKYLEFEINRLNMLPQYLKRPLDSRETWNLEQAKQEWVILKDTLHGLTN